MPVLNYFKTKLIQKPAAQENPLGDLLDKINECRQQFMSNLTAEERDHPLIIQLITNITFICPVFSTTDKDSAENALRNTMEELRKQFPRLSNAIDTFNSTFPEITVCKRSNTIR